MRGQEARVPDQVLPRAARWHARLARQRAPALRAGSAVRKAIAALHTLAARLPDRASGTPDEKGSQKKGRCECDRIDHDSGPEGPIGDPCVEVPACRPGVSEKHLLHGLPLFAVLVALQGAGRPADLKAVHEIEVVAIRISSRPAKLRKAASETGRFGDACKPAIEACGSAPIPPQLVLARGGAGKSAKRNAQSCQQRRRKQTRRDGTNSEEDELEVSSHEFYRRRRC